jgi:hypothetical protein
MKNKKNILWLTLFVLAFFSNSISANAQETKPTIALVNLHVPNNATGYSAKYEYETCLNNAEEMLGALTTALVNSRKYRVIERSRIDQIIQEQGFQKLQLSDSQVIRIGRILGVKKIITGEFPFRSADHGTVSIRIIDVQSGEIEAASSVRISVYMLNWYIDYAKKLIDELLGS